MFISIYYFIIFIYLEFLFLSIFSVYIYSITCGVHLCILIWTNLDKIPPKIQRTKHVTGASDISQRNKKYNTNDNVGLGIQLLELPTPKFKYVQCKRRTYTTRITYRRTQHKLQWEL